jgi:hypothetical protein
MEGLSNVNVFFTSNKTELLEHDLFACGFSQIPGIDLSEFFVPESNDIRFWIQLIANLIWNLKVWCGNCCPIWGITRRDLYVGMNSDSNRCSLIIKIIYGLMQIAGEVYKKLKSVQRKQDWSVFIVEKESRWNLVIGIYVEECLIVRKLLRI